MFTRRHADGHSTSPDTRVEGNSGYFGIAVNPIAGEEHQDPAIDDLLDMEINGSGLFAKWSVSL
jgi:hypothetical protein